MMKNILTIFLMLLSINSYAQGNTEALHHYLKFVEVLKKDQPLGDSLWQSFLLQAGNKLYIESNGIPEQYLDEYRQKVEIVYRPSKASLLKEQLL